jgi:hypothetical protein
VFISDHGTQRVCERERRERERSQEIGTIARSFLSFATFNSVLTLF